MNAFWFCCGKEPERRFCGAWLMSENGNSVIAYMNVNSARMETSFNPAQHKTYLRIGFAKSPKNRDLFFPLLSSSALNKFKVRIALNQRALGDCYLLVSGYEREQAGLTTSLDAWQWANMEGCLQQQQYVWAPIEVSAPPEHQKTSRPAPLPLKTFNAQKNQINYEPYEPPKSPRYEDYVNREVEPQPCVVEAYDPTKPQIQASVFNPFTIDE